MKAAVFKDKVTVITGASSGIGRELARQLADQGAYLTLASRNLGELGQVAAECRSRGGKVLPVQADVADQGQCQSIIAKTMAEYGRIDILINNAGYGLAGQLLEQPDLARFRNVIETNLMGAVYCTFHALPHLLKSRGRIVGVSSVLGKIALWGGSAYCASKFAMEGFFDALRIELMGKGVSVTMIYPGYVATGFAANVVRPDGTLTGEQGLRLYTRQTMSARKAARIIIKAAAGRKREKVLSLSGKLGVALNKFFPGLLDRMAIKIQAVRRARIEGK